MSSCHLILVTLNFKSITELILFKNFKCFYKFTTRILRINYKHFGVKKLKVHLCSLFLLCLTYENEVQAYLCFLVTFIVTRGADEWPWKRISSSHLRRYWTCGWCSPLTGRKFTSMLFLVLLPNLVVVVEWVEVRMGMELRIMVLVTRLCHGWWRRFDKYMTIHIFLLLTNAFCLSF